MKKYNDSLKINNYIIPLWVRLILIFMLLENPIHAQSLKNIKIGDKYSGPRTIDTTVGGFEGKLTISTLKDQTVTTLYFISKNPIEGRGDVQLLHIQADRLIENIQSNYNVTFDRMTWKHQENLTGLWQDLSICEKEGIVYLIGCTISLQGHSDIGLKDKESQIVFELYSKALSAKARIENDKDF